MRKESCLKRSKRKRIEAEKKYYLEIMRRWKKWKNVEVKFKCPITDECVVAFVFTEIKQELNRMLSKFVC